jgi:serine/threonine protein kinase
MSTPDRKFPRILRRCLAKDPDQRWQSARDLKAALEWAAEPSEERPAAPGRRPWPWITVFTACLVAAGMFVAAWWRTSEVPLGRLKVVLEQPSDA